MEIRNKDIRLAARSNMVPMWRVAEYLGICEMTLVRRLRRELTAESRREILDAIDALKPAEL